MVLVNNEGTNEKSLRLSKSRVSRLPYYSIVIKLSACGKLGWFNKNTAAKKAAMLCKNSLFQS